MKTPLLLLGFNRLDTFQQIIPHIRQAAPERVYIACDGPRNEQEKTVTDAVRQYLLESIDWTDKVYTLFRDMNLGCGQAVSEGITWFFENEDAGIILEDDCLPDTDFFTFCERNLEKYKDDERVSMIGGTNYLGQLDKDYLYEGFFSQYYPIWGWASWRRAWLTYDRDMRDWKDFRKADTLEYLLHDRVKWKMFRSLFDLASAKKIDTWDIQWVYSQIFQSSYALIPATNLISNIGFIGTHDTKGSPYLNMPRYALERPQDMPAQVLPNHALDNRIFTRISKGK